MKKYIGSAMLLVTALIWGTGFSIGNIGMNYVGIYTYNCLKCMAASLFLLMIILISDRSKKKKQSENRQNPKAVVIGGICCGIALFAASSLQSYGIKYAAVGKTSFITALYVVFVPFIGLLFHKKAEKHIWFCVALSIVGFYLMSAGGKSRIGIIDFIVLLSAVAYAVHIMVVGHFSPQADGLKMSCVQFITNMVLAGSAMIVVEKPAAEGIIPAMGSILYSGILGSGVGFTLQILAQKSVPPVMATLLMSLESVFGAIFGYLILHQSLSLREGIGCGICFLAVVFAQLQWKDLRERVKKVRDRRIADG